MVNRIYPTIKNSILLCLLILGIQVGLGLIIGFSQGLFNVSGGSLFVWVLTASVSIISFGIVLAIGFKKTKGKFNEIFKFNKVSPYLWISIVIFMIGFVIIKSELDNLLNYVLPMPEMLRNTFETLMVKQTSVVCLIIMALVP